MTVKQFQTKYDISLQEAEDAFWLATECAMVWLRVGSRSTATGKSGLPSVGARPRHLTSTTPSRPEVEEAARFQVAMARGARHGGLIATSAVDRCEASAVDTDDGAQPGDSSASPANVGTEHACAICGCVAVEHGASHRFEVAA